MSLERLAPEVSDPALADTMQRKLITFPVPRSLWLYMFTEHGYTTYHDTLWQLGGDPTKLKAPAADPDTGVNRFVDRIHAYYTDGGIVIARRREVSTPRAADSQDFLVVYTDLDTGEVRKMSVENYEHTNTGARNSWPVDTFTMGDGSQLTVTPRARSGVLGLLNLDGVAAPQQLIDDAFMLQERAVQARNYFKPQEIGYIANMYEVATMAA